MHRMAGVAVAVLAAALVLAAPSAARADSSGANRFDFHYCSPDGTFCSDGTTLQNVATTPSGRMVLTYHSQYSNTFSGFGCTGQTQERDMTTYLLTPDATGAYHFTNKRGRPPWYVPTAPARRAITYTCLHSRATRFAPTNQRWTALRRRQSSPPPDAASSWRDPRCHGSPRRRRSSY
jgi:hypothetical protein